jgi:hypothetical protein
VYIGDRLAINEALGCKIGFSPEVKHMCFQCSCSGAKVEIRSVQNFCPRPTDPKETKFTGKLKTHRLRSSSQHNGVLKQMNQRKCQGKQTKTDLDSTSQHHGLNYGEHMFAGVPGFVDSCVEGTPGIQILMHSCSHVCDVCHFIADMITFIRARGYIHIPVLY